MNSSLLNFATTTRDYVDWILNRSIKNQMSAISEGFYQIIPEELVKIFSSNDLQVFELEKGFKTQIMTEIDLSLCL
jgi:hypothetical protein